MFNKKSILWVCLISVFMISHLYASCGRCQVDKTPPPPKKSSALVTVVPESGDIEGLVIASCGSCNFGVENRKGCSLTIKIGDTIYPVEGEGSNVHDHGDAHSKEGLCGAVRVAYASGKIKKDKFHSDSFVLLESPE